MVPYLLKEDLDDLLVDDDDVDGDTSILHPYIVQHGGGETTPFFIFAEGTKICSTESHLKAFRLLMATFYVFNLAFPKANRGTLTFYQKVFLSLQDNSKKLPKSHQTNGGHYSQMITQTQGQPKSLFHALLA